MFSKTRTIIISLIAALSVASVGPMTSVANAQPKEGNARLCAALKGSYDWEWEQAEKALHEGHESDANLFIELARETYVEAAIAGCKWASAGRSPSPPIKVKKPSTNQGGPSAPPLANG